VLIAAPAIAAEKSIATEGPVRTAFVTPRAEARALVNLCDSDLWVKLRRASAPYRALPIKDKINVSCVVHLEVARFEREHETARGAKACDLAVEKFGPAGLVMAGQVSKP
jgi:hypothetical protein